MKRDDLKEEAVAARLAGKQVKREHVIIAGIVIALVAVVLFAWWYLHRISPLETLKAAVMPVRPPKWVGHRLRRERGLPAAAPQGLRPQ